jgi:hypothetical protein
MPLHLFQLKMGLTLICGYYFKQNSSFLFSLVPSNRSVSIGLKVLALRMHFVFLKWRDFKMDLAIKNGRIVNVLSTIYTKGGKNGSDN